MNRKQLAIFLGGTLLVVSVAAAQMMGGGGMRGTPASPMLHAGGDRTVPLVAGADGAVYTVRPSNASEDRAEILAIGPAGVVTWRRSLETRVSRLVLDGETLFAILSDNESDMHDPRNDDFASRVIALSADSGVVRWNVDLQGAACAAEPFGDGIYVVTVQHEDNGGSPNGMHDRSVGTIWKRFLNAIDSTGKVIWTIDLN